jgi:DnaK suppressor protein
MPNSNIPNIPNNYEPSDSEEYMCQAHLDYFKAKLLAWQQELLYEARDTLDHLQVVGLHQPDLNDQAAMESEAIIELKHGDRKRKLVKKIEEALEKIETGEYGYCDDTGEPIGLARLKARPIANLCIEAQERHENYEKQFVDGQGEDANEDREFE